VLMLSQELSTPVSRRGGEPCAQKRARTLGWEFIANEASQAHSTSREREARFLICQQPQGSGHQQFQQPSVLLSLLLSACQPGDDRSKRLHLGIRT